MPERLEFTLAELYLARPFFGYNGIGLWGQSQLANPPAARRIDTVFLQTEPLCFDPKP